jgi:hypothetical protein
MQMRGEWPPAGWPLAEEARGSVERASAVGQAAGFFFGWAGQLGCWRVEWPARRGVKRGLTAMGRVHARLIKAE